ncbi:MAG TPA: HAMP domain-containing sensor histidine kinase [Gemmatimonadaceae bacterium]|jgi:signal transduction histidine kinase
MVSEQPILTLGAQSTPRAVLAWNPFRFRVGRAHSPAIRQAHDVPAQRSADDELAFLLHAERSSAERLLNALRLVIIVVLGVAALAYSLQLPRSLREANVAVLAPMLLWSVLQVSLGRRALGVYPHWVSAAAPIVDATAVTAIILCYGLLGSPAVALKAPITLVYFAILAARPIMGSARSTGITAACIVAEYAAAVTILAQSGRVILWGDPITAAGSGNIALLDEGMKLVLLAAAGVVATYVSAWHERVLRRALAAQISRNADERELSVRLQEADKLAALGTLAACVAHEVNSPLTAIALSAEMLGRGLTTPADRDEAIAIANDARRTATALHDLLAFARKGQTEAAPTLLNDVVTRSVGTLRSLLRERHVSVERDPNPALVSVNGDASALERVVINLMINATQAMESQSTPRVIKIHIAEDKDVATLSIQDTGPGFAPGAAQRVFERFFTTKPVGKGTGLGLWMVAEVVATHGGTITAVDTGAGARFEVRLPLLRDTGAPFDMTDVSVDAVEAERTTSIA